MDVKELVRTIDALYAKATPGEKEPCVTGDHLSLLCRHPEHGAIFSAALIGPPATRLGDAELYAALHNAWPQIRDALEALQKDAERWREHMEVWGAARIPGALYVRMTMQPEASGASQVWHTEYVFDAHALGQRTPLGLKAIGLSVEQKAKELFAAIDEAKK